MQLYKLHSQIIMSHLHLIMSHNFSFAFNVGPNHFSFAFNSVPKNSCLQFRAFMIAGRYKKYYGDSKFAKCACYIRNNGKNLARFTYIYRERKY